MKHIKNAAAILLGPSEAGFSNSQINAVFHSESELIPTVQRSKRYFKYLD